MTIGNFKSCRNKQTKVLETRSPLLKCVEMQIPFFYTTSPPSSCYLELSWSSSCGLQSKSFTYNFIGVRRKIFFFCHLLIIFIHSAQRICSFAHFMLLIVGNSFLMSMWRARIFGSPSHLHSHLRNPILKSCLPFHQVGENQFALWFLQPKD